MFYSYITVSTHHERKIASSFEEYLPVNTGMYNTPKRVAFIKKTFYLSQNFSKAFANERTRQLLWHYILYHICLCEKLPYM